MVQDAEKFKEEDELVQQTIESKNKLEGFAYQLKSSINDEVKSKLSDDENQLLENTIQSLESWFSENAEGSKELYDQKYDEVNSSLNPILMKVHSQSNQGSPDMGGMDPAAMAQAMNGMGMDSSQMNNVDPSGPTIDEVD